MKRQKGRVVCLVVFCLLFSSCNPIAAVKEYFFGEQKREAVSEKKKKTSLVKKEAPENSSVEEKPKPAGPAEPVQPVPTAGPAEPVQPVPTENLPPSPPPPPPPSPPPVAKDKGAGIVPLEHFGGSPGALYFDGQMLYAGFGRRLVFFDPALNEFSSLSLEADVEKATPMKVAGGSLVYTAERGNIFEILSSPIASRAPAAGQPPQILKTFEVGGNFDIEPTLNQLFVYLPDKIQILDLNDLNKVQVIAEVPLGGASQMMVLGGAYYVVHGSNLTLVEVETLSTLADVPIGTPFRILGQRKEADPAGGAERNYLICLLASKETGKGTALQWMPMALDGLGADPAWGITDLGKRVDLASSVDDVVADRDRPFLYFLREGVLSVFDLSSRTELKGPQTPLGTIRAVHGGGGVVFAASDDALGRFEFPPSSGESQKTAKILPLASLIEAVWLPSSETALVVNPLFFSRPFLPAGPVPSETGGLKPLFLPKNQKAKFVRGFSFDGAVFLYDEISGKFFLVKADFSAAPALPAAPAKPAASALPGVQELNLAGQNIVGMDMGTDGKTNYLYLTAAKKDGKGETALTVYNFQSPLLVKKMGGLPFPEIGGVSAYGGATRVAVACGSGGVCLVDVGTERKKPKMLTTVVSSQKEAKAVEVKVSPDEKVLYAFYERDGGVFISLVNLTTDPPMEASIIPNLKMTASQFRGISFSAGGKILLLPGDEGLSIYNVTNPKNPIFIYRWPVGKVFHADVANRGKTVCAALGPKGLECGEF
ncbi:MAG: hypothetical protein HYU99_07895 [Deltaproteobacteria bacterium]|nr:hypothetical protein [Deltaproteobacteria bacterium]